MKALRGKHNYVYLHNDTNEVLGYLTGKKKLSLSYLSNLKKELLEKFTRLQQHNIGYIYCPIPDKAEIYPEYLPDNYQINHPTPLDDFFSYVAPLPTFDIRPTFLQRKDTFYHYCDTHLNFKGIYIYYVTLIRHLKSKYPQISDPLPINSIQRYPTNIKPTDLLNFATTIDLSALAKHLNSSIYCRHPVNTYSTIDIIFEDEWQKFVDRYIQAINFNPDDYLNLNPDVKTQFNRKNCFRHYILYGFNERRKLSPQPIMSLTQYLTVDPLVKAPATTSPDLTLDQIRDVFKDHFIVTDHARQIFNYVFKTDGPYYYQAYREDDCHYHIPINPKIQVMTSTFNDKPSTRYINENKSLPSVVVCHDSYFMSYMGLFLAHHFSNCVFFWNDVRVPFPIDKIIQENPTLVIHEIAGRFISG
jgi:hypothetical protein